MLVEEIMVKEVETVNKDESVQRVASLMAERKIGTIVVAEKKEPIGIVTERDLVTRILAQGRDPKAMAIKEVMSKPIISISKDSNISEAIQIMKERDIRRLVITEDNRLVGIISTKDITSWLSSLVVLRWI